MPRNYLCEKWVTETLYNRKEIDTDRAICQSVDTYAPMGGAFGLVVGSFGHDCHMAVLGHMSVT